MRVKEFIKNKIGKNILIQNNLVINELLSTHNELLWASIYHDSIRDKEWLNKLSLNVGRWAVGYPFLYILNRVLSDFKPKNILELGLGESSKVISSYLEHYLIDSFQHIIEHDDMWLKYFNTRFVLSKRSSVDILPLIENSVKDKKYLGYKDIGNFITRKYDLYCIDGPFGSEEFSRYDIVNIATKFNKDDEFIIIFDDYDRCGEKMTVVDLLDVLKSKNMLFYTGIYSGEKEVFVIGTQKYKYITSL